MAKSNKLFKDLNLKNKVSRNGFELTHSVKFTAKCGELLPLMHRTLMPGDNFRIRLSSFTRTSPVQTAAFTRIKEYFDFFFVPYRVLGKNIPHILSQDVDNPVVATSGSSNSVVGTYLPRIQLYRLRATINNVETVPTNLGTSTNEFGFYRSILSGKLLNHLGYFWQSTRGLKNFSGISADGGNTNVPIVTYSQNPFVSLLPLAAYQKIYYDFYRNTQWEDNQPYNYNFDYLSSTGIVNIPASTVTNYWQNPTMFDIRYANYPKDLFMGLYPDSQFGDTSVVDVDINSSALNGVYDVKDSDGNLIGVGSAATASQHYIENAGNANTLNGQLLVELSANLSALSGKFDILEFRKARFVQRYKEIVGTGRKTYRDLVNKIFNVDLPQELTDECYYLGGHSNVINISEVTNTNLAEADAIQKGKGVGSMQQQDLIEFNAKEPGVLMCIYHAAPEIDYALNAAHFDILKVSVDDFANPLFDNLGLQEFNVLYLDNTSTNNVSQTPFVGWTTRYYDYKTSVDMVLGDFRESLTDWVAPLTSKYLFEYDGTNESRPGIVLDYRFFKVNPKILDSIFVTQANSYINTDQLRVSVDFSINAVRPLSYLGIPN